MIPLLVVRTLNSNKTYTPESSLKPKNRTVCKKKKEKNLPRITHGLRIPGPNEKNGNFVKNLH